MYCSLLFSKQCSGDAVQLARADRLSRSAVAARRWQNGSSLAACTAPAAGVQLGPFLLTASLVPECLNFASVRLHKNLRLLCSERLESAVSMY